MRQLETLEIGEPAIDHRAFVAPGTHIYGRVRVGAGAVIMFGASLRAELAAIVIGRFSNVQDNVVMHADEGMPCLVGERVTVGHNATVHGAMLGDNSLVGIGARVLNGSRLGEGAWLASGAVLPEGREIPDWTLAVGIPAKPVRELTPEEIERQAGGVEHYQQFAAAYRRLLEGPAEETPPEEYGGSS